MSGYSRHLLLDTDNSNDSGQLSRMVFEKRILELERKVQALEEFFVRLARKGLAQDQNEQYRELAKREAMTR